MFIPTRWELNPSTMYILKSHQNSFIINCFEYLPFDIAYHHIIQPFVSYLITQLGFGDIHC